MTALTTAKVFAVLTWIAMLLVVVCAVAGVEQMDYAALLVASLISAWCTQRLADR